MCKVRLLRHIRRRTFWSNYPLLMVCWAGPAPPLPFAQSPPPPPAPRVWLQVDSSSSFGKRYRHRAHPLMCTENICKARWQMKASVQSIKKIMQAFNGLAMSPNLIHGPFDIELLNTVNTLHRNTLRSTLGWWFGPFGRRLCRSRGTEPFRNPHVFSNITNEIYLLPKTMSWSMRSKICFIHQVISCLQPEPVHGVFGRT